MINDSLLWDNKPDEYILHIQEVYKCTLQEALMIIQLEKLKELDLTLQAIREELGCMNGEGIITYEGIR